jgi:hypothetical protein
MLCIAYRIFLSTSSSSLLSPRADARGGVGSHRRSFPDRGASLGPSGWSELLDPGLPHLRYRVCDIAFATSPLRNPPDRQLSADMVGMLLYR